MKKSYKAIEATTSKIDESITIEVSEEKPHKPTLGPIGRKVKRNAQIQYNPYDWRNTMSMFREAVYIPKTFFVVVITGTILVFISKAAGMGMERDHRACRAWCSRFSLGTQPHSFIGFILFLLMAFRTREAYRMYQSGLAAHYRAKDLLSRVADSVLCKNKRDSVDKKKRARIIAFCIALPYAFTADSREERRYDEGTIQNILSPRDQQDLLDACSMPSFIIESLVIMVREYCEPKFSTFSLRRIYANLEELYTVYSNMEKLKTSRCAFAYVAHIRFLLIAYLTTLPLALVEHMGFATIPVFWVICYGLISLEMMAVEVENPFGYGASDLRMHEYNLVVKESLLESWHRFEDNLDKFIMSNDRIQDYEDFDKMVEDSASSFDSSYAVGYW